MHDNRQTAFPLLLMALTLAPVLTACNSTSPTPQATVTTLTTEVPTPAASTRTSTPLPQAPATALSVSTATAIVTGTTTTSAQAAQSATPAGVAQAPQVRTPQATEPPVAATEQPIAPETNPPGDIPDTQAFVKYSSSAAGYTLDVPEGWARTENGPNVSFVDKLDGVMVTITNTATSPNAASAKSSEVAALQQTGRAVQVTAVKDVQLPSGPAVLVEYTSNSEPNAVTGKQVRLENNAYLIYRGGKLATLTLWAPLGADNVDQWQRMSQSFGWR